MLDRVLTSILPVFSAVGLLAGALWQSAWCGELPVRPWSPALLQDATVWPHAERDARISVARRGLRVEVADHRNFAIAATSRIAVPRDLGRIRVRVAELRNDAKWFLRLYGDLRQPGDRRTAAVAQDETAPGERVFDIDSRIRQLPDAPLQLQLGVEGPPGAFAVFEDVALLSAAKRANRQRRTFVQAGQRDIAAVELMPNLPEPYELIDWREKARAYDRLVFDFHARGEFLPLVWLDESRINGDHSTFGLPSYIGVSDDARGRPNSQEGITCMGAVLGATLAGVDKSQQEHDYAAMCEAWFNTKNGLNLVLNRQSDGTGGSFWYELFPHIVFYAVADRYPRKPRLAEVVRITAGRWREVCLNLADAKGLPDFDHTSYDFRTGRAVDNGKWREPDAAAAVAWLQYAAWTRFHDANHLAAAENCIKFLQARRGNPYYEVLLPFGTLTAARMNAELGRDYDVGRLLNQCFGISDCRGGWGVIVGNWGGYDCDGLLGSIDNRGGYAFAMNTFVQAGALVPLVRYDPRYARAVGKWMLNLANSARLFYPAALPSGHETSREFWKGDRQHVIAYEGLRYEWLGKRPCACGDPLAMKWGAKTDLGLYGSGYVGMLGAIVRPTNVPAILQLDCLATDFFRDNAWPTFLCYNPHAEQRQFDLAVGSQSSDVYDLVTRTFVKRDVRVKAALTLPADSAAVFVVVPAGSKIETRRVRRFANGVVFDYGASS